MSKNSFLSKFYIDKDKCIAPGKNAAFSSKASRFLRNMRHFLL